MVGDAQAPRLRPYLRGELSKRYLEHIMKLPPCEWHAYPPLEALADSVTLAHLLPDNPLQPPLSRDLSPFLRSLTQHRDRYWARKQVEVKEKVLGLRPGRGFNTAHNLAKYVCVCDDLPTVAPPPGSTRPRNVTVCIGWPSMGRHACLEDWDELSTLKPPGARREYGRHELKHDSVLSSHSYNLIEKAGMNPEKATVADMDQSGPYFFLEPPPQDGTPWVFSWRGAVSKVWFDVTHLPCSCIFSSIGLPTTAMLGSLSSQANSGPRPRLLLPGFGI